MILNLFLIKLNLSKMTFLTVIFLTSMVSMSTNNWLTIWVMMETSLFMFIPLMSKNKIKDQSMKYFVIQNISSYMLIFSIILETLEEYTWSSLITLISLMIKIGMAPFHFWKPLVMSELKWSECMLLTTVIKIPPMVLINKLVEFKILVMPMIFNIMIGSISGLNQLNLKKMMAYSSIFNLTWMISSFLISKKIMMFFLLIYSMLNIKLMSFFMKNNLIYMNQVNSMPINAKISLNLNILSISGFPPLSGFLPKWIILNEMINKSIVLPSAMLMFSIISMFMYIQMNTFSFSNFFFKKKNNKMIFKTSLSISNVILILLMWNIWIM